MGILKEFRDFAVKGNVVDMAVGIIIGAAFGKIVGSMVNDVMMPPLGLVIGGLDFSDFAVTLKAGVPAVMENGVETVKAVPAVTMKYGVFLNEVINFTIVAFAVFLLVKGVNTARKMAEKEKAAAVPPAPAAPSTEVVLLTQIRDSLQKRA